MDFEKKYPLTQSKEEYVVVQWTRGYRQVDVYYNNQLIAHVEGAGKLQKGVTVATEPLGELQLKLSQQPVMLDVIVQGYHSPVNVSHPVKELKKTAMYFWILVVFSFIASSIEIGIFADVPALIDFVVIFNTLVLVSYIVSGVLVRRGNPVGFYIGFSVFCLITLISLLILVNGFMWGFLLYIFQAIRFGGVVVLATNLKTAVQASKHRKYKWGNSEDLLDTNF